MKNNVLKTIFLIVIILVIFLTGWFCSKRYYYIPIVPVEIHDTIKIDSVRIVEKTKIIDKSVFDTTYIWKYDTITDTIKLEIPIEHKEYIDTIRTDTSEIDLRIKYSGFKASLDEIDITNRYCKDIPVNQKKLHIKPSFNIGIGCGYGIGYNDGASYNDGTIRLKPQVQVGIYGTFGFSVVKY